VKRFYWEKKFILKKRSVSNGTEYDSLLTTVGQGADLFVSFIRLEEKR
jgi:hypothetical protein